MPRGHSSQTPQKRLAERSSWCLLPAPILGTMASIVQLPPEVLAHTFSFLPLRARLLVVSLVGVRFRQAVLLSIPPGLPRVPSSLGVEAFSSPRPSSRQTQWPVAEYGLSESELRSVVDDTTQSPTVLHLASFLPRCATCKRNQSSECEHLVPKLRFTALRELAVRHISLMGGFPGRCLVEGNPSQLTKLNISLGSLHPPEPMNVPTNLLLPHLRSLSLRYVSPERTDLHFTRWLLSSHQTQLEDLELDAVHAEDILSYVTDFPRLRYLSLRADRTPFGLIFPDHALPLTELIKRAPKLISLVLDCFLTATEFLEVVPLVTTCLAELSMRRLTDAQRKLLPTLCDALQQCKRLTSFFPAMPNNLDADSELMLQRDWAPLILSIADRLEHLSVPWLLRGVPEVWSEVWTKCTRFTSLHLTAFAMWHSEFSGLDDIPFARLENLELRASDFEFTESHRICSYILRRAPRLRHLVFIFDEVNPLRYLDALLLLRGLWSLISDHCPNMRSFIWRSNHVYDFSEVSRNVRLELQARNPWVELHL